jgi:hypothetical protein
MAANKNRELSPYFISDALRAYGSLREAARRANVAPSMFTYFKRHYDGRLPKYVARELFID